MTATLEVLVVTYNHEPYLAQALDSVLAQRTDFDVRVTVLDDCSSDSTAGIAARYAAENPGRLELRANPVNTANCRLLMEAIERSQAEFLVVLDGDDYWTDPSKLQKQVEWMRGRPGCALCYHNVRLEFDDGRPSRPKYEHSPPESSTIRDLFVRNFIATCSVMFRRAALQDIPGWFRDVMAGDWFLFLLAARSGTIAYLPDEMAVYRIHSAGRWSKMSAVDQWQYCLGLLDEMRGRFDASYHADIDRGVVNVLQYLAHAQAAAGNSVAALSSLADAKALCVEDLGPPAVVRGARSAGGDEVFNGEPGEWLSVACDCALPTSFVVCEGTGLATVFTSASELLAFLPARVGRIADGPALGICDIRDRTGAKPAAITNQ